MYTKVKLNITEKQRQKIKKALTEGSEVSLHFSPADLVEGNDLIALTKSQLLKLKKAGETGKGATIKMSKTQVAHNMKIEGGILPLLAGLAAKAIPFLTGTVLPALGVGALSGLASTGVQKLMGDGLYIKKGGCVCEIETDGGRLLLEPVSVKLGFAKLGDGLYLKQGRKMYDGKGLLLGPNSPFKNIPILGLLL